MNEVFVFLMFFLVFVMFGLVYYVFLLRRRLREVVSRKQSQSTRYGQIFEQMIPFSKDFPFDPKCFRFIGSPIDGVVFEDDRIVFVEIKMNNSNLSFKQKNIKRLVNERKVYWKEIRG